DTDRERAKAAPIIACAAAVGWKPSQNTKVSGSAHTPNVDRQASVAFAKPKACGSATTASTNEKVSNAMIRAGVAASIRASSAASVSLNPSENARAGACRPAVCANG